MVISGLRRTRNPCSSSCYQSFLVDNNNLFVALRIPLGEPPEWRRLARNVRYHSGTHPRKGFQWSHKLCILGELTLLAFSFTTPLIWSLSVEWSPWNLVNWGRKLLLTLIFWTCQMFNIPVSCYCKISCTCIHYWTATLSMASSLLSF